jgi:hypothetical protein
MPVAVAQQALGVALGAVPEHLVVNFLFGHRASRVTNSLELLQRDYVAGRSSQPGGGVATGHPPEKSMIAPVMKLPCIVAR